MQGTPELQKLKSLRDNEKRALAAYIEQQDRAIAEHERRLAQVVENIRKSEESIKTWNNLIELLEYNRES
jgi:hypothetical protein